MLLSAGLGEQPERRGRLLKSAGHDKFWRTRAVDSLTRLETAGFPSVGRKLWHKLRGENLALWGHVNDFKSL